LESQKLNFQYTNKASRFSWGFLVFERDHKGRALRCNLFISALSLQK